MAILFDANLGVTDFNNPATTGTLVTTAAAAAATRIVVDVSYWKSAAQTLNSVSDGAAYTLDKKVTNGGDTYEKWSRHATAGLTLGATITLTFSSSPGGGVLVGASSFTGVDTTAGAVDTTSSATGSGTGWASGSATNAAASALFHGGSGNETVAAATSTPVNGAEIHDRRRAADGQGFATGYTIAASIASQNISGTFTSSSTANTGALVIYKDAGSADAPPPALVMAPYRSIGNY